MYRELYRHRTKNNNNNNKEKEKKRKKKENKEKKRKKKEKEEKKKNIHTAMQLYESGRYLFEPDRGLSAALNITWACKVLWSHVALRLVQGTRSR
ncbi:hypothetical protein ElyMa_000296500 [Elysia marginata]|uniref:Uncharacterized protein n=1 Tax=Elysia marginata TaxID=1093978 RepID=A0AAV4F8P4_9GAST|nr:hypothetical protein ElyMa_000296500 [Elysia marginata]